MSLVKTITKVIATEIKLNLLALKAGYRAGFQFGAGNLTGQKAFEMYTRQMYSEGREDMKFMLSLASKPLKALAAFSKGVKESIKAVGKIEAALETKEETEKLMNLIFSDHKVTISKEDLSRMSQGWADQGRVKIDWQA
jgi:hypothetical protein